MVLIDMPEGSSTIRGFIFVSMAFIVLLCQDIYQTNIDITVLLLFFFGVFIGLMGQKEIMKKYYRSDDNGNKEQDSRKNLKEDEQKT